MTVCRPLTIYNVMHSIAIVTIELRNVSDRLLVINDVLPPWDYDVVVTDSHGKEVAPVDKNYRPGRHSMINRPFTRVSLKPGKSYTTPVDIARFFKVSGPGTYTVSVSRQFGNPGTRDQYFKVSAADVKVTIK